jgi:hypothetical protein
MASRITILTVGLLVGIVSFLWLTDHSLITGDEFLRVYLAQLWTQSPTLVVLSGEF